ncbi:MAG: NnrS family protein [Cohaesibacter sp.]|nr:NnrS family protein [Cohaesibacter sp.]
MSETAIETKKQTMVQLNWINHPLFSDGFRVFFPLAAISGLGLILFWGLSLSGFIELETALDPLTLHRYDMIFGFLVAGMAGFLTTAVPSWSKTASIAGWELVGLAVLWSAGRLAFWAAGWIPTWLAFSLHFLFLAALALRILPPLWTAKMRHLLWPVSLLLCAQGLAILGYATDGWQILASWTLTFETGLIMAEGAFSIMVLTALAPISTVIVNHALQSREDGVKFIPRPPFRRAAMICLGFYMLARMGEASQGLQGWLALAAACSILNILQDWHMHGALSTSFSRPLYCVYWFLAAGLCLQGLGLLELFPDQALMAGRHMLFIGGFSLATLMVLIIAGTRHTGRPLDMKPLFRLSIWALIAACLARSVLPLLFDEIDWMMIAWLSFAISFGSYLVQILPWVLAENEND